MFDYSSFIVETMKYVDEKIENLNSSSIDRTRLHTKVQIQLVANIERIAMLERSDAYREIDNIFGAQLRKELSRHM